MRMAQHVAAWAKAGGGIPYLDISGSAYVDTGYVIPSEMTTIRSDLEAKLFESGRQCVFYSRGSSGNPSSYLFMFDETSSSKRLWYGFGAQLLGGSWTTGVKYSVVADETGLYIGGEKAVNVSGTFPSFAGTSVILFAFNKTSAIFNGRWYGHKLTVNGTLVRDWRPFKDGNGTACVKDFVTGNLLYHSGTGAITYGEEAA